MARVISVVNQKGGVGKTTTAVNLASYLAHHGKRVLLVDLDPQGNATSGFGIDPESVQFSLYESMMGPNSLRDILIPTNIPNLNIVPANQNLAGANIELAGHPEREFRLHNELSHLDNDYDYIVIDSPPSLGLLTINGLVAAKEILIPVQCEYYALEGLGQLLNTISLIKEHIKQDVEILGAVMTMYDERSKLSRDIFDELYRYFPHRIFRTVVPRNSKLAEAPSFGKTILHYDPQGVGARAYGRLAKELDFD
jgi:chromosome partitioning protein